MNHDDKAKVLAEIQELKRRIKTNPNFMSLSYLGCCYERIEQLDEAASCLEKATTMPHGWGADQASLLSYLESLLGKRPADPTLHVCLGQTFQKLFVIGDEGASLGELAQAEAEYRQAIAISPGHRNAKAEELLKALPALKAKAIERESKDARYKRYKSNEDKLKSAIEAEWKVPEHEGFLLTRCSIGVDSTGTVRRPAKVVVPSGSHDHDESVLNAIRKIEFAIHPDPNFFGIFDFACWTEQKEKCINFVIYHRVAFPAERQE